MPTNVDLLNEGRGVRPLAIAAYKGASGTELLSEDVKMLQENFSPSTEVMRISLETL